jgi:hypothetical protein
VPSHERLFGKLFHRVPFSQKLELTRWTRASLPRKLSFQVTKLVNCPPVIRLGLWPALTIHPHKAVVLNLWDACQVYLIEEQRQERIHGGSNLPWAQSQKFRAPSALEISQLQFSSQQFDSVQLIPSWASCRFIWPETKTSDTVDGNSNYWWPET